MGAGVPDGGIKRSPNLRVLSLLQLIGLRLSNFIQEETTLRISNLELLLQEKP